MEIETLSIDTVRGPMEAVAADMYITPLLQETGRFSEGEARLYQALLDPGALALDIGSNIGVMALAMADAVGSTGRVLAFEPQPLIYDLAARNTASRPWVSVERKAVGASAGRIEFANRTSIDEGKSWNFGSPGMGWVLRPEVGTMVETEVITVDGLGLDRCDLIKVDVEGAEPDVMAGAWLTIERFLPALSVEIDRLDVDVSWADRLQSLGYRLLGASIPIDDRQVRGAPQRIVSLMAIAIPDRLARRPVPKINGDFALLDGPGSVRKFSARAAGRQ